MGIEVKSEFVGQLDLNMKKYLETFEHFTIKDKKLITIKLNMIMHLSKWLYHDYHDWNRCWYDY